MNVRGLPLLAVAVSLHYLPRCLRSAVTDVCVQRSCQDVCVQPDVLSTNLMLTGLFLFSIFPLILLGRK